METADQENKLRTRSSDELAQQMEGLLALKKVLQGILDHWYLSGGTLLGAYRDGDFIPWDWDVEVTVLTEEASEKEGQLLKALLAAGFVITSSDSSKENFKIVAGGWGTEYEILGRYLKENEGLRSRLMTEVPAGFFDASEIVVFRGHEFPAPSPADGFLEALYGDWKTPLKTADKQSYFSASSYRKGSAGRYAQRLKQISQLLRPMQVQEFPEVEAIAIERFHSWDKDLGWCNPPNCTKVDKSDRSTKSKKSTGGLGVFSTDEKGSRRCRYPTAVPEVSFYGDSYCMCRDVQDEQTAPWYLSELRETRISNYGVGNYGLDQALLRLQRDYHQDPAKIVVLAITSITMARCVSVYRHYLEPGNLFAIKPRFQLINTSEGLQRVDYPLKDKKELLNLKNHQSFFRDNDEHFKFWRKNRLDYYTRYLLQKVLSRFGLCSTPSAYKTFEYEISFWESHENLFYGMMKLYQDIADHYGFRPIFLLQHHKRSLEFLMRKSNEGVPWVSVIAKAAEKFPGITFLDEADIFADCKNLDELYTRSHHSAKANHMIADYLNDHL